MYETGKLIVSFEIQNTENGNVLGKAVIKLDDVSEVGPLVERILLMHGHDDLVISIEVDA